MRFFQLLKSIPVKVFVSASVIALMYRNVVAQNDSMVASSGNTRAEPLDLNNTSEFKSIEYLAVGIAAADVIAILICLIYWCIHHFCVGRRNQNLAEPFLQLEFIREANNDILATLQSLKTAFQKKYEDNPFQITDVGDTTFTCPLSLASLTEVEFQNRVFIKSADGRHTFFYDYQYLVEHIANCSRRSLPAYHPQTGRGGLQIDSSHAISIGMPGDIDLTQRLLSMSETRVRVRV